MFRKIALLGCILLQVPSLNAQQQPKMDHSHMPIALPDNANAIGLSLSLVRDAMSGFNLTLHTSNYSMALPPEELSMMEMMSADIDAKSNNVIGHGHLYVNGEKVQRIYGKFVHLPAELFSDGINSVSVTLNNHGHMYWTQNNKQVLATLFVNPQASSFVTHRFESFPATKQ